MTHLVTHGTCLWLWQFLSNEEPTLNSLLQSLVYDQMQNKNRQIDKKTAKLKNCRLENMGCCKYQLIFVTAENIFFEAISFLAETAASAFHSLALRVIIFVGRKRFRFLMKLILIGNLLISGMQWRATYQGVFCFTTAFSGGSFFFHIPEPPPSPNQWPVE